MANASVGSSTTVQTSLSLLQTQLSTTSVAAGALSTELTTLQTNLNSATQVSNINFAELNITIAAYTTQAQVMATLLTNLKSFLVNTA